MPERQAVTQVNRSTRRFSELAAKLRRGPKSLANSNSNEKAPEKHPKLPQSVGRQGILRSLREQSELFLRSEDAFSRRIITDHFCCKLVISS